MIPPCKVKSLAVINESRTAFHGHGTWGYVRGTQVELSTGRNPSENRVEIFDKHGVRFECVQTFFDRFRESFLNELVDFIECILKNKPLRINLRDAIDATQVAFACREAYISGKPFKLNSIINLYNIKTVIRGFFIQE